MQETPNVSATGTSSDIVRSFVGTTLLTFTFFSNENVDKIQNMIRYLVHKYTSQIVGPQDYTELLVIMRSMYLQYANNPPDLQDGQSPKVQQEIKQMTTQEVLRLNKLVILDAVPRVVSGLQQQLSYLNDASQPYGGNDLRIMPISTSIKGEKELRTPTQVFFGGNF